MTEIVVIGDSPLSFLAARTLDRSLGSFPHIRLRYVTRERSIGYQPALRSLEVPEVKEKKGVLPTTVVTCQIVKSINLREQRVITDKTTLEYDFLILDRTPVYLNDELKALLAAVKKLTLYLRYQLRSRSDQAATIKFKALTASTAQLALAIRGSLHLIEPGLARKVRLVFESSKELPTLQGFLEESGLEIGRRVVGPGLTIDMPSAPVLAKKIKGLSVDRSGRAVVGAGLNLANHPEVFIVDYPERKWQNLWRHDQVIAESLSHNLQAAMNAREPRAIDTAGAAMLVHSATDRLLLLGKIASRRLRARAISRIDQGLFTRLTKR